MLRSEASPVITSRETRRQHALRELHAAAVGVQAQLGVDKVARVREHPVHAAGRVGLLVGAEEGDDVALGHPALTLPASHVRHEGGHAGLCRPRRRDR